MDGISGANDPAASLSTWHELERITNLLSSPLVHFLLLLILSLRLSWIKKLYYGLHLIEVNALDKALAGEKNEFWQLKSPSCVFLSRKLKLEPYGFLFCQLEMELWRLQSVYKLFSSLVVRIRISLFISTVAKSTLPRCHEQAEEKCDFFLVNS